MRDPVQEHHGMTEENAKMGQTIEAGQSLFSLTAFSGFFSLERKEDLKFEIPCRDPEQDHFGAGSTG